MAIDFGSYRQDVSNVRRIGYGSDQTGSLGGAWRPIDRLGARHAVDVAIQNQSYACAAAIIGKRLKSRATRTPLRVPVPQPPGLACTLTGVQVNGANQTGLGLVVDGLPGTVAIPAGTALSFIVDGISYLYVLTDDVPTSLTGTTFQLDCLLRASPADNTHVELVAPVIEGFATGTDEQWSVDRIATDGLAFTIQERI